MKSIFTIGLGVFIIVVLLFYIFQRHLIYVPNKYKPTLAEYHAQDMEQINLHTEDGLNLYSWYKPAINGKPTILYTHGNAGHIGNRMNIVRPLLTQGYGVLLLEYRGYGGNKGKPSETGLYQDARAGVYFLQQQGISNTQIVYYGESLGTAIATQMAMENPGCSLILQTPFTSLKDIAHFHYPWLFFMSPWDKYNSLSKIQSLKTPLLLIHGTADRVVPYEQGVKLFEHASQPKQLLTLHGYDHHNLWQDNQFITIVVQFLEQYCAF